jgi:hypothetical protein
MNDRSSQRVSFQEKETSDSQCRSRDAMKCPGDYVSMCTPRDMSVGQNVGLDATPIRTMSLQIKDNTLHR